MNMPDKLQQTFSPPRLTILLPILFLGLLIPASLSLHRTVTLSLPISLSSSIATLLLPILTLPLLHLSSRLSRPAKHTPTSPFLPTTTVPPFSIGTGVIFITLIIYDVVLLTLAATWLIPSAGLNCALEQRWKTLWMDERRDILERIQDRYFCCGFGELDKWAWPSPLGPGENDGGRYEQPVSLPSMTPSTPETCAELYHRYWACDGFWRMDTQITAGLMVFVALVCLGVKLGVVTVYRVHHLQAMDHERRLAVKGKGKDVVIRVEEPYRDEVEQEIREAAGQTSQEGRSEEGKLAPSSQPV